MSVTKPFPPPDLHFAVLPAAGVHGWDSVLTLSDELLGASSDRPTSGFHIPSTLAKAWVQGQSRSWEGLAQEPLSQEKGPGTGMSHLKAQTGTTGSQLQAPEPAVPSGRCPPPSLALLHWEQRLASLLPADFPVYLSRLA